MTPAEAATNIAVAFIGGGALQWGLNWARDRKRERDALPTVVDANILSVSRARDELESDNTALRETLREERAAHATERQAWAQERTTLRAEVEALEAQLRAERDEHTRRYDALLDQLADIRTRHGI